MSINQETENISAKTEKLGRRMKMFGVITIILGLVAMASPLVTGLSVVMSVGLLVIAGGILRMIWAFSSGSFGKGLLAFAMGGLTLLCGLTLLGNPLFASALLTVLLAVFLFADGVAEIVGAFSIPREAGRAWMLIGGACSIVLGLMIWRQYPLSGSWALGVLLGIRLFFIGIVMLTGGSAVRSLAKAVGRA